MTVDGRAYDYEAAFLRYNPSVYLPLDNWNRGRDISGNGQHADFAGGGGMNYGFGSVFAGLNSTDLDGSNDYFQVPNYLTRTNLVKDGNFEYDEVGNNPGYGYMDFGGSGGLAYNLVYVTDQWAASGGHSVRNRIISDGTNTYRYSGVYTRFPNLDTEMACVPGDQIYSEATVNIIQSPGLMTGNVWPVEAGIDFYGAGPSYTYITSGNYGFWDKTGIFRWQNTMTVPASCFFFQFGVYTQTAQASAVVDCYIDNMHVETGPRVGSNAFHGDSPGASWHGTPGRSSSSVGPFANGSKRAFVWIQRRDTNATRDNPIGGTDTTGGGNPYLEMESSAFPGLYFGPSGTAPAPNLTGLNDDLLWNHFIVQFDEKNDWLECYRNGVRTYSAACTDPWGKRAGPLQMGVRGSVGLSASDFFDGKLSHVGVVEGKMFTSIEAANLYAALGGSVYA